jgi:nuclear GTP-binding protein
LTAAARIVLRDWCIGKLLRYTTPAPIEAVASVTTSDNLYDRDEQILATVRPRKELRKLGSVRLSPSAQETRVVALDAPWISVIPDEEDEDDLEELNDGTVVDEFSEDEDDASVEGNEEEIPESDPDDEDEDEDEDEEEVLPPPPTGKRKRRDSQPTLPLPSKKVVFARNAQGPTLVSKEPSAPLKSVLKKSTPKVKTKPLKKVSNIKGSKSTKAVPADADAYDFSKFF